MGSLVAVVNTGHVGLARVVQAAVAEMGKDYKRRGTISLGLQRYAGEHEKSTLREELSTVTIIRSAQRWRNHKWRENTKVKGNSTTSEPPHARWDPRALRGFREVSIYNTNPIIFSWHQCAVTLTMVQGDELEAREIVGTD